MDPHPQLPLRLPDLSPEMRLFLAAVREDEIDNLKMVASLDEDERQALQFIIKNFKTADLAVINDSLESLRTMKCFGRFGMWLMGMIIAFTSVVGAIKILFMSGSGPKWRGWQQQVPRSWPPSYLRDLLGEVKPQSGGQYQGCQNTHSKNRSEKKPFE